LTLGLGSVYSRQFNNSAQRTTKDKIMTTTKNTTVTDSNALLALGRLGHVNLASNASAKSLRADVQPGKHQGEVSFKLVYDITVGEDHQAQVAASVPWKAIAGALFAKLNAATRDKLVRELLADDFTIKDGAANAEAEAAIAELIGSTEKTVSGKITGSAVLLQE
jgi:hypothetical protein